MAPRVRIRMHNGTSILVEGYVERVVEEIQAAKLRGELAKLDSPATPAGQFVYLDPTKVSTVAKG